MSRLVTPVIEDDALRADWLARGWVDGCTCEFDLDDPSRVRRVEPVGGCPAASVHALRPACDGSVATDVLGKLIEARRWRDEMRGEVESAIVGRITAENGFERACAAARAAGVDPDRALARHVYDQWRTDYHVLDAKTYLSEQDQAAVAGQRPSDAAACGEDGPAVSSSPNMRACVKCGGDTVMTPETGMFANWRVKCADADCGYGVILWIAPPGHPQFERDAARDRHAARVGQVA